MQGDSLLAAEPRGLPPGKLLPQHLKDLGYTTRAVGKWHLGFYKREVTPTYRGFDSHLGYWNDYVSYYDYILQERASSRTSGSHSGTVTLRSPQVPRRFGGARKEREAPSDCLLPALARCLFTIFLTLNMKAKGFTETSGTDIGPHSVTNDSNARHFISLN
jgi:hypothetical protein